MHRTVFGYRSKFFAEIKDLKGKEDENLEKEQQTTIKHLNRFLAAYETSGENFGYEAEIKNGKNSDEILKLEQKWTRKIAFNQIETARKKASEVNKNELDNYDDLKENGQADV